MERNRYYSLNQYLQEHFHEKCYKLALRGGDTCPNRDGTVGYGGCIFCGEGSGNFASATIDEAIARLADKHTGSRYIAYFQSYTATYRMSEQLIRRMYDAAQDERIAAVSIATRPDCLEPEVLDLLADLNRIKPVWVELGLQTIHESTAQMIRRGYKLKAFEEAVRKLRDIGIEVIVHLILGLPGETEHQMLESIHYLNDCDIQGVKFQLLHVLKGTALGEELEKGVLSVRNLKKENLLESDSEKEQLPACDPEDFPFTLDAYADLICKCISYLRPDIVVHRITGDAPKKDLLAPLWSGDKKKVLNTIRNRMDQLNVVQGSAIHE